MRKPFNQDELAYWFSDCFVCSWCGQNHWNAFHHGSDKGQYTNSILNAVPLFNTNCHIEIHSKLRKPENVKMLLGKTLEFLLSKGYVLSEIDKKFIEDHKQIYQDILKTRTASV